MLNNELRRWYLMENMDGSQRLYAINKGDALDEIPRRSCIELSLSEAAPYIVSILVQRIKDTFKEQGHTKAVLGLSGGIDSAVVYSLLVRALGANNVTAMLMPSSNSSQDSEDDALDLIRNVGVKGIVTITGIGAMVDSFIGPIEHDKIRRGNIAARCRMIVLFDYASANRALVVGTENKSEHLLGYFTLFGDSASCVEPIQGLYKTEVFEVAKHLPEIPQSIINKKPSADLWEGQTDEGELGFTYLEADKFCCGRGDELSEEVRGRINKRIKSVVFKHRIPFLLPCEGAIPNEP